MAEDASDNMYEQYHHEVGDIQYHMDIKHPIDQDKLKNYILANKQFKWSINELAAYIAQGIAEEWNENIKEIGWHPFVGKNKPWETSKAK